MPSSLKQFCPALRDYGSCLDPACPYSHVVHTCKPCSFISASEALLNIHLNSKKHKKTVENALAEFYECTVCNRIILPIFWSAHSKGAIHVRKCAAQGVVAATYHPVPAENGPGLKLCGPCNTQVPHAGWIAHTKSKKHREQRQWDVLRKAMEKAELDKNGVSLEGNFDFDFVNLSTATAGTLSKAGTISVTESNAQVTLLDAILASSKGNRQSSFDLSPVPATQVLRTGNAVTVSISLKQAYPGRCEDRIELIFEDDHSGTQFVIARPLYATVGNKDDHNRLKPIAPYKPPSRTVRQPETKIFSATPAISTRKSAGPCRIRLPLAEIPKELEAALSDGTVGQVLKKIRPFLPHALDSQTHGQHFKYLVWIEEYRQEQDMGMYDLFNVKLTRPKVDFRLKVPGLAEKRPSVLMGDRILAQPKEVSNGHWFEGLVLAIEQDSVLIRFNGTFKKGWSQDKVYNVRFKLNRQVIRREQYALNNGISEDRILFPTSSHLLTTQYIDATSYPIQIVNPNISTNPRQLQAVVSIVNQPRGSPPFIVFGPPGTGKTVTMVEAIRQLLKKDSSAKVFACAPSNSAADLITSRLMDLGNDVVFRFYAPTRQKILVPQELLDFTHMNDSQFSTPSLEEMNKYRVVIATCGSSIFATSIGMARGHFSHVFVDEAGQASEPEVMIAVKTIPDSKTNIVLSGDPKQLGPVIRSAVARHLNLEESYLERLMKNGPYDIRSNFGVTVVKLVKNFRSHNAILKFPNERFYEDELQACGDTTIINSFLNSRYLPNGKFPVVFHGVQGKDDREASSPSFFNIDEVLVVADYVKRLLAEKHKFSITESDIGVISPYNAQSRKIRTQLKAMLGSEMNVKVDSVEGFQGQERRVIIISTVRSSTEFIEYDLKHTLGFVASPRRFNVAVTRAQALLIVVGDPTVLSLDPLWRSFLNYIHDNHGWTGSPITWDPTVPVDEAGGYDKQIRDAAASELRNLTRKAEELTMAHVEDGEGNVDRSWLADE